MDEETTSIKQEVRNERLTSLHNIIVVFTKLVLFSRANIEFIFFPSCVICKNKLNNLKFLSFLLTSASYHPLIEGSRKKCHNVVTFVHLFSYHTFLAVAGAAGPTSDI